MLWGFIALVGIGVPALIFAPVLIIPGFIIPMCVMYIPAGALDNLLLNLRRKYGVVSVESSDRLDFDETVLILKSATTQVISLVMISVPMISFLRRSYGWGDASEELLSFTTDVDWPTIKNFVLMTLEWPSFVHPRITAYLAFSAGALGLQFLLGLFMEDAAMNFLKYLLWPCRAPLRSFDTFFPIRPTPSILESRCIQVYSYTSWAPFRFAMDLTRTAVDGAYVRRTSFIQDIQMLLGDTGDDSNAPKPSSLSLFSRRPKGGTSPSKLKTPAAQQNTAQVPVEQQGWSPAAATQSFQVKVLSTALATLVGPVFLAIAAPRTKIFGVDATDNDVLAFVSDESCLAYKGIVCENNRNLTIASLEAISKCIWLEIVYIRRATRIKGPAAALVTKLTKLKKLDISGCSSIIFSTNDLSRLGRLAVLSIINCTGISGPLSSLSRLTTLEVLRMKGCTSIQGSMVDLAELPRLHTFSVDGCTEITGSRKDLNAARSKKQKPAHSTGRNTQTSPKNGFPGTGDVELGAGAEEVGVGTEEATAVSGTRI